MMSEVLREGRREGGWGSKGSLGGRRGREDVCTATAARHLRCERQRSGSQSSDGAVFSQTHNLNWKECVGGSAHTRHIGIQAVPHDDARVLRRCCVRVCVYRLLCPRAARPYTTFEYTWTRRRGYRAGFFFVPTPPPPSLALTLMASSKLASVRTRTLPSFSMAALAAPWRAAARTKRPISKRFIVLLFLCVRGGGGRVMSVMMRGNGRQPRAGCREQETSVPWRRGEGAVPGRGACSIPGQ